MDFAANLRDSDPEVPHLAPLLLLASRSMRNRMPESLGFLSLIDEWGVNNSLPT